MTARRKVATTAAMLLPGPVANAGTFVFPYPTGETQSSAWDGTGHQLAIGGNIYTSGFTVAFGSSTITVTNSSLGTIPAGSKVRLTLQKFELADFRDLGGQSLSLGDRIALARMFGTPVIIGISAVAVSAGANTDENTLATIAIPARSMGLNGRLRVWTLWTTTSSGNNKTVRVRLGGAAGTAFLNSNVTTSVGTGDVRLISNVAADNSQKGAGASVFTANGGTSGTPVTGAIDTSADTTLVISGQKASSGETLTLESYSVELLPG